MVQNMFNSMELDAIGEIMNISLGSSATAVSNMLDHRVDITTPSVSVVPVGEFSIGDLEPAIGIEIKYVSGLKGSNILLLRKRDVKVIVDILMGSETPEEEFELNELTVSAVCEVMNQMMGAASTALSDFLGHPVNISTPQSFSLDDVEQFKRDHLASDDDAVVVVRFVLSIENVLKSEFINAIPVHLARELLAGFELNFGAVSSRNSQENRKPQPDVQPAVEDQSAAKSMGQNEVERGVQAEMSAGQHTQQPVAHNDGTSMSQDEIERMLERMSTGGQAQQQPAAQNSGMSMSQDEIEQMLAQMAKGPVQQEQAAPVYAQPVQQMPVMQAPAWQTTMQAPPQPKRINATPIEYTNLETGKALGEEQAENLEMIMSVPLEVSVEIGRVQRKVEDILSFSKGSLVVLDKLAGDQVDLYVNGLCIARGDVVVIDDNFGVRITEVLRHNELLK